MTEDPLCVDKVRIDAEQRDAEAQFHFGEILAGGLGGQGERQEIHWRSKSTNHGNYAKAQVIRSYHFDFAIQQDYEQAVHWYTKSAKQGYAPAQYNLGLMYHNGAGVEQDSKQAAYWWEKAALLGYAAAQYNLGLMYHNGDGVLQDYAQAIHWYAESAAQGYEPAQNNLRPLIGAAQ